MKKMKKKKYSLIQLLDAGRIIVGDNRGFGSRKESYEILQRELKNDWEQRHERKEGMSPEEGFAIGEHVLVNTINHDLCQYHRAVVLDATIRKEDSEDGSSSLNKNPPSYAFYYSVFLYDDGSFESIHKQYLTGLSKTRKEELEPRAFIVRLTGIVPANPLKPAVDLKKLPVPTCDLGSSILNEPSSWPESVNEKVLEWLSHRNVRYIGVAVSKINPDGSLSGEIYRRPRSNHSSSVVEDANDCPKEYLTDFLVIHELGVRPTNSLRVHPRKDDVSKEEDEMSKVFYSGVCNEDLLAATRFTMKPVILSDEKKPKGARRSSQLSDPFCADSTSMKTDSSGGDSLISFYSTTANDGSVRGEDSAMEEVNIPGRLLVRARFMKCPYSNLQEFQLNESIIKALSAIGVSDLSDMHKIVAPNFIRGTNLILISPDGGAQDENGRQVRALSYLLPILRIVYDKYDNMSGSGIENSDPPEVIIIVKSYNTGTGMEGYIKQLLNFSQHLPMRVKFVSRQGNKDDRSSFGYRTKMVPRGISILIITMPYLAAIMQTTDGPFLLGRLRFLIFEEADLYLKDFSEDILTFINAARQNLEISFDSLPFQIVFSGSKWTSEMETLYKEMVKDRAPMVTIAGANQVIRYAKIKWKVHYVKEEEGRLQRLGGMLEKSILEEHQRTVIACSTASVASTVHKEVVRTLGKCGVQMQLVISGLDKCSLDHSLSLWRMNAKATTVMVISDDMMHMIPISNATCLICYDSPLLQVDGRVKRSVAAERFGYLWANIRHIEIEHDPESTLEEFRRPQANLIAHFLMTGEEHNFFQMYKFGTSFGEIVEFPRVLKHLAKAMEQAGSQNAHMCPGTKLFGFCNYYERERCPYRHFFSKEELSATPSAPFSGEVEVRIMKCENPSLYKSKLIRHFNYQNGKRILSVSYDDERQHRKMELEEYYGVCDEEDDEKYRLRKFKEGSWCTVKIKEPDSTEFYARAKLEKILQRDKCDSPSILRVYCVDSGLTMNPTIDKLYRLPREFQRWPPLVVDLILCNLKPTRVEADYRQVDSKKAKRITADKVFNARIWLSIGNTIWVNPMIEHCVDPSTKKLSRGASVRYKFFEMEIAEFNGTHLKALMEDVKKYPGVYKGTTTIYEESSSRLSEVVSTVKKLYHQMGDKIQWAFVEKSSGEDVKPVKIVTQVGYGPWLFFGVHDEHFDILKKLEKDLHQSIEVKLAGKKEKDEELINFEEIFNETFYQVGMVVAAKERVENAWVRALIIKKTGAEAQQKNASFDVFLVDIGDTCDNMTAQELFPIPRKFVTQLPFQAMAFKLDHIQPLNGAERWTDEVEKEFVQMILKDDLSIDVELVAYEEAERTDNRVAVPCRFYNAVSFYEGTELGSSLVGKGSAEWNPGKENLVTEIEVKLSEHYSRINAIQVPAVIRPEDNLWNEPADFYIHGMDLHEWFGIKKNGIRIPSISLTVNGEDDATVESEEQGRIIPSLPVTMPAPAQSTSAGAMNQNMSSSVVQGNTTPCVSDGFLRPQVLWRQTSDALIFTINVPDLRLFDIKVLDHQTIHFETLDRSPNYCFKLKLYGKVESECSTHLTGRYLRITLNKKMKSESLWIRPLYLKDEKYRWFKADLDFVQDEDDSDDSTNNKDGIDMETLKLFLPEEDTKEEGLQDIESDFDDSASSSEDDESD